MSGCEINDVVGAESPESRGAAEAWVFWPVKVLQIGNIVIAIVDSGVGGVGGCTEVNSEVTVEAEDRKSL